MAEFALSFTFVTAGECYKCGVPIALPKYRHQKCLESSSESFFCCNGHSQVYAKSECDKQRERADRAERERDAAAARATMAENSARAHRGKVTEMKNRIANGVCPCCKRSFANLHRHMTTKHPDFKDTP